MPGRKIDPDLPASAGLRNGATGIGGLAGNRTRRGIALVIVLGFLVLITVLIVAYFTSVATETATAKTYANGAAINFLADSAVNIVMGQIAKGTQGKSANGERLTWASQPGMIRTFGTFSAGTAGNYAEDCYKLYSSSQMVIPSSIAQGGGVLNAMAADIPSGWNNEPAFYTDLNAPVIDAGGNANFPIMDGNHMSLRSVSGVGNVLAYHTSAATTPDIEGSYVQPGSVPNYNSSQPLSATNSPVPMPVQWLYALKDGTVVSPDPPGTVSASGSTATFTQAVQAGNGPSATNPIVGRIAFWTDDESCKLNINTACEGTYFASPRVNSNTDMKAPAKVSGTTKTFGFSVSPPEIGEYNRYPGHPATNCLSVALGTWLNSRLDTSAPTAYTSAANDQYYLSDLANYQTILPRSGTGGSLAGTFPQPVTNGVAVVSASANRLFASFDELMFNSLRAPNMATAGPPQTYLTRPEIEELKFFLTAHSRAPELTPFNTPKVSMWPYWLAAADRTNATNFFYTTPIMVTESLVAFCSTFGPLGINPSSASSRFEYFIERCNPSGSVSTTNDWNLVPRNRQLANYLWNLGAAPIPGYGAAFTGTNAAAKYSARNFSSMVIQSIDYIRSEISRAEYDDGSYDNFVAPLVVTSGMPGVSGTAAVKGFGFYPTCYQFVIGAVAAGSGNQPFIAFDTFQPTMSIPGQNEPFTIQIQNPGNLGLVSGGVPVTGTATCNWGYGIWNGWWPKIDPIRPYVAALSGSFMQTGTGPGSYIIMGSTNSQPVIFNLMSPGGDVAQQISVLFPQVYVPVPLPGGSIPTGSGLFNNTSQTVARGMLCGAGGTLNGDWRLLTGLYNVPAQSGTTNAFISAPNYSSSSIMQAHCFRDTVLDDGGDVYINGPISGNESPSPTTALVGSLVAPALLSSSDYMDESAPCTPVDLMTGATMSNGRPGDWDTGLGYMPDGPYVNPLEQGGLITPANYYTSDEMGIWDYGTYFPNRMVASAVRFGSLPTGLYPQPPNTAPQPWQTLLFCPNPAGRIMAAGGAPSASDHYGFTSPPDHLYLNFFTMPVVQPYAISEPFSTAGKVNLNYQLAPFTYIERSTALRGVLKSTLMTGISALDVKGSGVHPTPASDNQYKWTGPPDPNGVTVPGPSATYPNEIRYNINRDATIAGIEEHYFNNGLIFRYPSEICDVFLVPQRIAGATYLGAAPPTGTTAYDSMVSWWNGAGDLTKMSLTGDNLREEPYDRIYPRVTTQSNAFTVHYRVQALQKALVSNPAVWQEGQDAIVSEHRGSSLIERYIDPNDPKLTGNWDSATMNLNFTQNTGSTTDATADLSQLYKFRVVSTKKFAP